MLSFTPAITNSCKTPAISSGHDLKSIGKRNLYLGPLHIIDRVLESVMVFNPLWLYDQLVDINTKSLYNLKSQE